MSTDTPLTRNGGTVEIGSAVFLSSHPEDTMTVVRIYRVVTEEDEEDEDEEEIVYDITDLVYRMPDGSFGKLKRIPIAALNSK